MGDNGHLRRAAVTLALLSLAALDAHAACVASTRQGYTCQKQVVTSIVHWKLAANEQSVDIAVECASVSRYCAIGVGSGMVNSNSVFGTTTVMGLDLPAKNAAQIATRAVGNYNWLSNAQVSRASGKTVVSYTHNVALGGTGGGSLTGANMVHALGSSDALQKHAAGTNVVFAANWKDVVAAPPQQPPPPPPAPAGGANPTATPGNAPVATPSPPTAGVPPTTPGASLCTASPLLLGGGSQQRYACSAPLSAVATLHWTHPDASGRRQVALAYRGAGWFAMGFPNTQGTMGPGEAIVVSGGSASTFVAAKYSVAGAKARSSFAASAAALPLIGGLAVDTVGGDRVLRYTDNAGASAASSAVLVFNLAMHSSDPVFQSRHTSRQPAVRVDLRTAGVEVLGAKAPEKVKAHGALHILAWAYLAPLGVLVKRFGSFLGMGTVGTENTPVPFVVHATVMFCVIVLTIAMTALALAQFDGVDSKTHRALGITVMVLAIAQLVMQVGKCSEESSMRVYFRIVHVFCGLVAYVLATAQLFVGARDLRDKYAADGSFADGCVAAAIVGICLFVLSFVVLSVLSWGKMDAKKANDHAPDAPEHSETTDQGHKSGDNVY